MKRFRRKLKAIWIIFKSDTFIAVTNTGGEWHAHMTIKETDLKIISPVLYGWFCEGGSAVEEVTKIINQRP